MYAFRSIKEYLATPAAKALPADQRTGLAIVRNAIQLPAKLIASNAGVDGSLCLEGVLDDKQHTSMPPFSLGYDAQTGAFVNMYDAGIVDPVRVIKTCVVNACSVAGMMITTEAAVTESVTSRADPAGVTEGVLDREQIKNKKRQAQAPMQTTAGGKPKRFEKYNGIVL